MAGPATQTRFPAFGGHAVVAVADPAGLTDAVRAARDIAEAYDLACSRFRDDSELSRVNRSHGPAPISPLLARAIAAALTAARQSGGAVDPTVGAALLAAGYDRDFDELDAPDRPAVRATAARISAVPGWRAVTLEPVSRTVRLPAGVRLDLGATAKALAADDAAAAAAAQTGTGVLVAFGGDAGTAGAAPPGGWSVRVTDDHRAGPDAPGQSLRIAGGGVATSGVTARRWSAPAGMRHHLIDPATGEPAGGPWRTASVAAASCLDANTASTAAIVRGAEAVAWLTELGLPARLVAHDGTVHHLAGWPAAGEDAGAAA